MDLAVRNLVYQRALDCDRDWRAFDRMLQTLRPLRAILKFLFTVMSGGTVVTLASGQPKEWQIGCAIAAAVLGGLLEVVVTSRYLERVARAAQFEREAYFEWFELWRRIDRTTEDEVAALERRQIEASREFQGLTWARALKKATAETSAIQVPILANATRA